MGDAAVPAHHLTEDRWRAIRAEWVTGAFSTRALAAKAGVSEKAIRLRASDPRQEGGPWQRDGGTPRRQGRRMVTVRTLRGSAEGRALLQAPIDAREEAEERRRIAASPEVRAALREIAIDSAAEALARHNLEHLRRPRGAACSRRPPAPTPVGCLGAHPRRGRGGRQPGGRGAAAAPGRVAATASPASCWSWRGCWRACSDRPVRHWASTTGEGGWNRPVLRRCRPGLRPGPSWTCPGCPLPRWRW